MQKLIIYNKYKKIKKRKWNKKSKTLVLILTLRLNDWVIRLYKKIRNLSICLAQQSDHAMFILWDTSVLHFLENVTIPKSCGGQILMSHWVGICMSGEHKFSKNWNPFSKQPLHLEAADHVWYAILKVQ